jgi:CDP-diacylglycerol--glycerol-3-phosphate 3-phosphatidyltransferase
MLFWCHLSRYDLTVTTNDSIPRATGWKLHTPNALVGVRLILSVGVFALLSRDGIAENETQLILASCLFVVAAVTDALDGFLARNWDAITRFGRIMDPLADKILIIGSLVMLAGVSFTESAGFTGWMVIVIVTRELLVTSLRGMLESEGIDASANWSGKAKMILQSVSIPAILLLLAFKGLNEPNRALVIDSLAWLTTIVTAISALPYITKAISATKES